MSTPPPWASDRPLPDDLARRVIASQFPRLAPVRITARAEGWDNEVVEINGEWMFRFPKRADYVRHFERELQLLPRVAPRLPLAVPRPEMFGEACEYFPYPFAAYRKLDGVPASQVLAPSPDVATQLGAALSALHAIPPGEVGDLDLPTEDGDPRSEALADLESVANVLELDVANACRALLEGPMPVAPATICLLHADLGAEHVLLSHDGSGVAGIIDWTDAALGDPARDFAGLWAWQGDAFTQQVLAAYSRGVDAGFEARARLYGICAALADLDYAVTIGDEARKYLSVSALRRAFP